MNYTPQQMLANVGAYLKNMEDAKSKHVMVGLPKDKVGGKIYDKVKPGRKPPKVPMTVIRLGAIHEYPVPPMPRRSFLRTPFAVKRADIDKAIAAQFVAVAEKGMNASTALGRIGAAATNIAKTAFVTNGYGMWKKSKKKHGRTMIDTNTLRNSLTWSVRS